MAELLVSTFADEASIEIDTDRRSEIVLKIAIRFDGHDREEVRQIVEALNEWLERSP